MTSPLPLGFPQLFDRLGLPRPVLPSLGNDILPVVVYADWSRSLASEVFEARAQIAYESGGIGVGGSSGIGMLARSAGGLVVEQIVATVKPVTPGSATPRSLFLSVQDTALGDPFAAELEIERVNLGGIPTVARPFTFSDPLGTPPDYGKAAWPIEPDRVTEFGARIWVPSGSIFFLTVAPVLASVLATIALIWRELSGHQGGA